MGMVRGASRYGDDADPLDGLEDLPLVTQVAVMANELRNQARRTTSIERGLKSVQVALWGLVIALLTASITVAITIGTHH